jgi:hypothetical protein
MSKDKKIIQQLKFEMEKLRQAYDRLHINRDNNLHRAELDVQLLDINLRELDAQKSKLEYLLKLAIEKLNWIKNN